MYIYIYICTHVCVYIYTRVCVYVYIHRCASSNTMVDVCVCVYIYIHVFLASPGWTQPCEFRVQQKVGFKGGVPYRSYLVGGWATPLKNRKVNWDG